MSLSHLIGTQSFLPALLAHIRNSATAPAVPLDHVIFQSILLCLIAGEKHLILRTPEEDVPLAAQLAAWTLSCIFDRTTRRLRIRARGSSTKFAPAMPTGASQHDGTTAFLRSLFIQPGSNSADDEHASSENTKHFVAGIAHARRSPPYPQTSPRAGTGSKARRPHSEHHAHGHVHGVAQETIPFPQTVSATKTQSTTAPTIVRPKPVYPHVPHAYTDPLPLPGHGHADHTYPHRRRKSGGAQAHAPPEPPHALVLSNLEDASDAVQRALARVLAEKRIVLPTQNQANNIWELPDGFFTIAVCPWSATERPALHKSLLDKFSMSANVFVPSNVRRDLRLLPFSVPTLRSPGGDKVFPHSTPNSPARPPALALPVAQTPPPALHSVLPPNHQHSHAYPPLSAHLSAHPHPHPTTHQRPATYAAPTAHPHSAPSPVALFPAAPVTPALLRALQSAHAHTRIAPALMLYLSDTLSAARAHSKLDALLLSARAHSDAEALVRAVRVVGTDLTGTELLRPPKDRVTVENVNEQHGREGEEGTEVELDDEEEDYRSALDVWAAEGSATAHGHGSEHERAPLMSSPIKSIGGTSTKNASVRNESTIRRDGSDIKGEVEVEGVREQDDEKDEWQGQWLDAAEVDVARVVPRVVSHRVRLRSEPQDEVLASALFGATFVPPRSIFVEQAASDTQGQDLDSVKAVLVQILAEV